MIATESAAILREEGVVPMIGDLGSLSAMSSLEKMIEHDDPITRLVIMYAMMRGNGHKATFIIEDNTLYLISEYEFFTMDMRTTSTDVDNVCNPEVLYGFSPLYGDKPGTEEGISNMLNGYISDHALFKTRLTAALNRIDSTDIISYDKDIDPIIETLHMEGMSEGEILSIADNLATAIVKYRLLNITRHILQTYPCNPDIVS